MVRAAEPVYTVSSSDGPPNYIGTRTNTSRQSESSFVARVRPAMTVMN